MQTRSKASGQFGNDGKPKNRKPDRVELAVDWFPIQLAQRIQQTISCNIRCAVHDIDTFNITKAIQPNMVETHDIASHSILR